MTPSLFRFDVGFEGIDRQSGKMTPEELEIALEAMKRLKVMPRDLLPNRLLLEKAQSIYETLPSYLQEALDPVITDFEASLERQSSADIEESREYLRVVLEQIESQI